MTITRLLFVLLALALPGALVAACGSDDPSEGASTATPQATANAIERDEANANVSLSIGSKNFTEQKVLGEIYAQAFAAAGYKVHKELNLGDEQTALKALKSGQISGYPEYTGTALLSFLNVPAGKLPTDAGQAYDQVKAGMAKEGIEAFPPTPFTSSNEVGMLKTEADKLGVTKISDLKSKAGQLTLYGSPECRTRRDCLLGLEQVYGLKFKKFVPVNVDPRVELLHDARRQVLVDRRDRLRDIRARLLREARLHQERRVVRREHALVVLEQDLAVALDLRVGREHDRDVGFP